MARIAAGGARRLVLDTGGVFALARGARPARFAIERARRQGFAVVIPTAVIAEAHRGGRSSAATQRVFDRVDAFPPLDVQRAREAGELLGAAGMNATVDAVVVAEALASVPSVIVTSDPSDIRALLEGRPGADRVAIVAV